MAKHERKTFPETNPELLEQWDWELNEGIDPYEILASSADKYYWKCLNNEQHPSFLAAVNKRTRKLMHDKNHGCPVCANRKIIPGLNDLASQFPELEKEWNYEKNTAINLSPEEISGGSNKKAWWICTICGHEWEAVIASRSSGRGCPVCAGKEIIPGYNDMATLHPELMPMLHPTMNGDFDPHKSASYIDKKLYWQCPEHEDHVFEAKPGNILNGKGCPYCANKRVKEGFNDFQSQHPELMSEWDWEKNDIDPSTIVSGSKVKAHWKCKYGHEWETSVLQRTSKHTGCPQCSRNRHTSFVEIFAYLACCEIFGENRVMHRDKELFGFELDVAVPEHKFAIEPGSWKWHGSEYKQNIDRNKRKVLEKEGWVLFVIYDSCDRKIDSAYPVPYGWHYFHQSLADDTNALISSLQGLFSLYVPENVLSRIDWNAIETRARKDSALVCYPDESLAAKRAELLSEWDYDKNNVSPDEILPYSSMPIWWTCSHNHSYEMPPGKKTTGCPYCEETVTIPGINHISDVIENIEEIWDSEANRKKKISLDKVGASRRHHQSRVSLICPHCGHHFSRTLSVLLHGKRANHNQCPECGGTIAVFAEEFRDSDNAPDDETHE